jgi:hypothetical protein
LSLLVATLTLHLKESAGMSEEQAEQELFDYLVAEFGDRGQDAVQFLRTARRLVAEDPAGELPRAAGAAAYCVREALQRLLPPESGRPRWRELVIPFFIRVSHGSSGAAPEFIDRPVVRISHIPHG